MITLKKIANGEGYGDIILGTWTVLEDGKEIGKLEKRSRMIGVCGKNVNYITRYRKETTYHFKPVGSRSVKLFVGTNKDAARRIAEEMTFIRSK